VFGDVKMLEYFDEKSERKNYGACEDGVCFGPYDFDTAKEEDDD